MKFRHQIRFSFLLLFSVLVFEHVLAQDDWEEVISDENGIVLDQRQQVEIDLDENGQLIIQEFVYEEKRYLSDNAKLYREQSVGYSDTFSEIIDLQADSYIPSGKSKFKKIPVKDFTTTDSRSSGIFYDDHKKISYVFPALNADSKTVVSYTKKYREPRLWGYYMFSSFFPVEKSTYSVKVSNKVKINYYLYGIDEEKIDFTMEQRGKYKTYSWKADHLEKLEISKGANGLLHTAPHLIIYVDSYQHAGESISVLGGVQDLHAWYQNFLKDIDDEESEEMRAMVENIIVGKSTELEKVEAIYNWVQDNIKYIAIEDGLGGFRPRPSGTVFKRRYGDCKDMSNLIHNMLSISNIPSSLTWIGTTSIPYSHSEVPTPMADNHMICTYKHDEQYYFLDATDQYNKLGIPSSHIQGREALINKGSNDFELVNVPVVSSDYNLTIDSIVIQVDGAQLIGSGYASFGGYNRIPITNNLENLSEDDKKSFLDMILKKGNNKFSLKGVKTRNLAERDKDLQIDYQFALEDYVIFASDKIYLNPHFDRGLERSLIDKSLTKKPIHYDYKSLSSNIFKIMIPEGYSVSYIPENITYEQDDFSFCLQYRKEAGAIWVDQMVKINTLVLETNQFDLWNSMIKKVFAAYQESIVLSKN